VIDEFLSAGRYAMPYVGEKVRDLYQEFGCTAVIRPFTLRDETTGQTVAVTISPQYSILRVGDREYYFKRESGEFDGTSIVARE
jgi:hypothetical protein